MDPWYGTCDPWQSWHHKRPPYKGDEHITKKVNALSGKKEVESTRSRAEPSLLATVKHTNGVAVHFYDASSAAGFLAPLRSAFVDCIVGGPSPIVEQHGEHGKGWRSRVVEKKGKKKAENQSRSEELDAVKLIVNDPLKYCHLDIAQEIESRMSALLPVIEAQVKSQILLGVPAHDARLLLPPEVQALAAHAKHTYRNTMAFSCTPLRELAQLARSGSSQKSDESDAKKVEAISQATSEKRACEQPAGGQGVGEQAAGEMAVAARRADEQAADEHGGGDFVAVGSLRMLTIQECESLGTDALAKLPLDRIPAVVSIRMMREVMGLPPED